MGKRGEPGAWAAFTEQGKVPWWVTAARAVLIVALCAAVPTILGVEVGRRLLWTVTIAALPLFWVVGGFHLWRRICPLAAASQLARLVGRPGARKLSTTRGASPLTRIVSEHYILVQLALMLVALSARLVVANGNAAWLVGLLAAIVVLAVVTGFLFSGKTWCNYLCPVGLVEKIYTEPIAVGMKSSQCHPCTACKKHCPDIDLEAGYWKELDARGRHLAYFAWPGIVLGFYVYYWAVAGDWGYYFDGGWTYETGQPRTWSGPGFFFSPQVPRLVAAPLTLVAFGAASAVVFTLAERALRGLARRRGPTHGDPGQTARHQTFAVAGFAAINLFYFFGGQPTLRLAPDWVVRGFGLAVVVASTALLLRRLARSERDHIEERFAHKLLARWEWGDAPPSQDLRDVYLVHAERKKEREARLAAYKETVRELVADGTVTRAELVILDSLRGQLGVSDRDHQRIVGELSDEDRQLFDPAYQGSVERALSRAQYERELSRALVAAGRSGAPPDDTELGAIGAAHGVDADDQTEVLTRLRAADGPLAEAARAELAAIATLADAAACARGLGGESDVRETSSSAALLAHLCVWRGRERLRHVLALVHAIGLPADVGARATSVAPALERAPVAELSGRLAVLRSTDAGATASLLEQLIRATEALTSAVATPAAPALLAIADDRAPHLRAAALLVVSRFDDDAVRATVTAATDDREELVRETAYHALGARGWLSRELASKALADAAATVRRAAVRATLGPSGLQAGAHRSIDLAQSGGGRDLYATLDRTAALDALTTIEKMMRLRAVPLFAGLPPEELEDLAALVTERRFRAGQVLCRRGERGDDVFLLIDGTVRITDGDSDGELDGDGRLLAELGPGSYIGEMAAFDDAPRSATARAASDARALVLPGDELGNLLLERPEIARAIIAELAGRLRRAQGGG